jgi:pilus assembly protein CpaF
LRLFRQRPFTLSELAPPEVEVLLAAVITARLAFLITGGTGSGKTTLLNALLGEVSPGERIVTVEDSAELQPIHPHVVGLEARKANVEGAGAVTLRDLVREALRMRPDRIIVGECRGPEVIELLLALNTGHDGGAGTLHANSPTDTPARLEALALTGGLDRQALHAQLGAAVQVVLHVRRLGHVRMIDEVCMLLPQQSGLITTARAWGRDTGPGPAARQLADLLMSRGVSDPMPLLNTGGRRP